MNSEKAIKLLEEAIEDGRVYLPRLKEGLAEVVTMLQEGREGEGINLFIRSLEGLEWLETVFSGIEHFQGRSIFEDEQGNINTRYRQALADLLEAWENRDMVLISDLLEFEVVPVIEIFLERVSPGRGH